MAGFVFNAGFCGFSSGVFCCVCRFDGLRETFFICKETKPYKTFDFNQLWISKVKFLIKAFESGGSKYV